MSTQKKPAKGNEDIQAALQSLMVLPLFFYLYVKRILNQSVRLYRDFGNLTIVFSGKIFNLWVFVGFYPFQIQLSPKFAQTYGLLLR